MRKMIKTAMTLAFGLMFTVTTSAQTPAMVNWKCAPPDSQHVSASGGNLSGLDETGSSGFAVRDYNNGPGPDQRWWPYENGAAVSWGDETTQSDTRWVQFGVHPNSGFEFHTGEITIYLGAKGSDKLRANVQWDIDTDFSNATLLNDSEIALLKDSDSLYTFSLNTDIPDGDTLYVRIYPWYTGSPSTSKYLYVRDATISGTTMAKSYSASASWELSDPGAGGSGLTASTSGQVLAEEELLNNTEINKYTGPDGSQRVRILGNEWPANQTARIDSVFIQFAVAPKADYKLTITSVSLGIAAASLNTMKADICYSTDSTFASSTLLEYITPDTSGNNYLPLDVLVSIAAATEVIMNPGESFYLRVYPWVDNDPAVRTGKYICLKNVVIGGEIEGTIIIDPPTVTTTAVSYISTTFASSGGNISEDGGAPVTVRGVCWNTAGAPTISDDKTEDGLGSGSFASQLTNLIPGSTYFLRAYATNEAATAYGEELSFTTLNSIVVPAVETASVTNIMVKTAACGGEVSDWGGDTVNVRGICWNTGGNPTVADEKTENRSGLGNFTSTLSGLTENTTYYVRAYATNVSGTGYGSEVSFTTQMPAPAIIKIVALDGSGDYTTVQAAFDDIPDFYTGPYTIFVKAGEYYEKLLLDRNKTNVILVGEDPETTILTYDDYAGKAGGTSMSYSVAIDADDFAAMDISFRNTVVNDGSFADQQGVALRVNGDRQTYYNCRLLGYQDTYYTWGGRGTGRVYMKNCYIEGSVDFIFGRDIVVFDNCEIHINREGGTLTAASTEPETNFGYVFRDCQITADSIGFDGRPITSFILGRPWQQAPRTVFIRCEEPASLNPDGWSSWNVVPALYAEYLCTGPGSETSARIAISRQLTDPEAAEYTLENIFSKSSNPDLGFDWMPTLPEFTAIDAAQNSRQVPAVYALYQNFPNPFNPTTTISYDLPESVSVVISLYNLVGEKVMTIVDRNQSAGHYSFTMQADQLPSGVYFYRLEAGDFIRTRKLILLK